MILRKTLAQALLACSLCLAAWHALARDEIRLGIFTDRAKELSQARWAPLEVAINRAIPGHNFVINVFTLEELERAVSNRQVDFVLTSGSHYILLSKRSGLSVPLATLVSIQNGETRYDYGGVIFTRAEQSDINVLEDIRGKSVAYNSPNSFDSYLTQAFELREAGLNMQNDIRPILTGGAQDNIVKAVLSGHADVGFIRSGLLEDMAEEGSIRLSQAKVIHLQNLPGYPDQVSTRLYPEWVFAALPHSNRAIERELTTFLLTLDSDPRLTKSIDIKGFDLPATYTSIEDVMREMRVPPFEMTPEFTVRDIWQRYTAAVVISLVAGIIILLMMFWLMLSLRRLSVEQKALFNERKRMGTILDTVGDPIFVKDNDHKFVIANRSFYDMLSLDENAVTGKTLAENLPECEMQHFLKVDRHVLDSGIPDLREEPLTVGDFTRTVLTRKARFVENSGERFLVGSIHDLTERRQAEQALTESMHKLEEKELAKTRFLAAAGHDLRQPLAAANLFIDALRFTDPTADQNKIIQRLDQAMTNFNGLLDALLNVSRLDSGVVKPEYTSINLSEVFNWLEQNFIPMASEKKLGFKLHLPMKETLFVFSDIDLLKSVLMNLVSNAIKYTSNGAILISARRRGGDVLFQVWDTGMGMEAKNIEHIFDEFYQINNPQRDRTSGLGLGLAIAKRALMLLGGKVACRSRPGRGTVFEFRLPLGSTSGAALQQGAAVAEQDEAVNGEFMRGKHFIVVEDDALVAEALSKLLEAMGGKVLHFPCAEHALNSSQIENADYYIADYMLSGTLNGMQFLNQLRQKLGRPISAVLMTGDTSPDFMQSAENCDWPVLHKPVDVYTLISGLSPKKLSAPST